ncbi:hypothetical protein [uncultured Sulfitobacter sp.]|uniref:hypothetical protein n=1 Tax=uncultured Sulfitobacter sp. TaxID=191468 RepID=UPI002606BD5B|nr:hypothetical protein [uncultured Sulfitobacter sp.]
MQSARLYVGIVNSRFAVPKSACHHLHVWFWLIRLFGWLLNGSDIKSLFCAFGNQNDLANVEKAGVSDQQPTVVMAFK